MKGKIIVITGTDGSGKETQTKKLYEYLQGKNVNIKTQSFPNYASPSSEPVKMYLGGELSATANGVDAYQASSLFAVDRLCTMKKYESFLNNGGVLLLDRYMESNYFHQVGKIKTKPEQEKFLKWLEVFEFDILKIPKPDLIIFLDMPPEISIKLTQARQNLKNGEKKDIHESDANHIKTAYANGKKLAIRNNWNIIHCYDKNNNIKTIDKIQSEVREITNKFLENNNEKEL